ncbi:hypothetical protein [Kutzneria albida]|uniref:Putative membrane protein n=1 Tax=Kutzneria albida DSM 43870 TaxID=1449976 RepID=W5W5Z1_9PSEU|nr:hypothetical protein [Kutzneria albida]AHH96332.1 putative membrane protein [Kutzneria albida DSM 43870]
MIRYLLADLLRSQRFVPPFVLFAACIGVLYGGDPGNARPVYGVSTLLVFPLCAWLTVIVANNEDPVQRRITVAAVGGWPRMLGGLLGAGAVSGGVLVLLAVAVPPLINFHHPYQLEDLAVALVAHLISLCVGLALGLVCSRPLIPTTGWSLLAVLGACLVLIVSNDVPPVGPTAKLLFDPTRPPATLFLLGQGAVALAVLLLALGACHWLGRRRG